eukprot:TRINITY_DN510_c0_g1_i3.p1 TRINITY_DN510_c0_g1~~TRINITY_DN510_c0_g1_i3.p1  ORF type:complete len:105 (+),score=34.92 TRINITY_DN510_c0_g1_i3:131-445(+)
MEDKKKKKKKPKKSPSTEDTNNVETIKEPIIESELTEEEIYQKELQWCISQLEIGLKRATREQAAESNAVITKLRSDKYPKAGKRSLMRVVFGDYRKKMKEQGL